MKVTVWCKKHKRRHSKHAAWHCQTEVDRGGCVTRHNEERGEACPLPKVTR